MPNAFGGRAGFDVYTSHVFPHGMLEAISLIGGGAVNGGATAGAAYEVGFFPLLSGHTTLLGVGSNPKLLEQKP